MNDSERTAACALALGPVRYLYTDRDGVGTQDPAIRAYGSPYVGRACVRAGAWWRGKAVVQFDDGSVVVVRARLLRRLR